MADAPCGGGRSRRHPRPRTRGDSFDAFAERSLRPTRKRAPGPAAAGASPRRQGRPRGARGREPRTRTARQMRRRRRARTSNRQSSPHAASRSASARLRSGGTHRSRSPASTSAGTPRSDPPAAAAASPSSCRAGGSQAAARISPAGGCGDRSAAARATTAPCPAAAVRHGGFTPPRARCGAPRRLDSGPGPQFDYHRSAWVPMLAKAMMAFCNFRPAIVWTAVIALHAI